MLFTTPTPVALNNLPLTAEPINITAPFISIMASPTNVTVPPINIMAPFINAPNIQPIKAKVMSMNNNAFAYGLTNSIKPSNIKLSGTEPSTARRNNDGNNSSNNKGKNATYLYELVNVKNLTADIDFLNCHFNNLYDRINIPQKAKIKGFLTMLCGITLNFYYRNKAIYITFDGIG